MRLDDTKVCFGTQWAIVIARAEREARIDRAMERGWAIAKGFVVLGLLTVVVAVAVAL